MTKAVRVHKVGGPEALVYEAVDVPAPASGEVRIRQHAIGLNFIDVYYRTGLYKAPALPFVAGNEASGEVLAVGPGVTNFHPGDRVAYYFNLGGYASERNIPAEKLVKLPDHITYEQGAVLMLTGAALICLSALGELPWWVTGLIMFRELGVTGLRFWGIRRGVIAASRGGKAKTLLQIIAICLYLLPASLSPPVLVRELFMAAAVVVTVVTGADYVLQAMRLRRSQPERSEPATGR